MTVDLAAVDFSTPMVPAAKAVTETVGVTSVSTPEQFGKTAAQNHAAMGGTHVVYAAISLPLREHVTIFSLGMRQQ